MKQFLFSTLLVLLSVSVASSQEYKKSLKNANKTLGKYYSDPVSNKASLEEALGVINSVFSAADASADPEALITKGQIFNEIGKAEMNRKILDSSFHLLTPTAGIEAIDAFDKAMTLAAKKSHTKDALEGIKINEELTNNIAITYFQDQDYGSAYKNFKVTLKAQELLKANGEKSRLDDPAIGKDQLFYTAVSAYFSDYKAESVPLFEKLYIAGEAQPLVYEALFNMASESNIEKAMEYLDAGRKANPDDNGLLFAEINYYLKVGRLNILTDKLKAAIEKEPDNLTVYTTLGNVYDQLNQKERAAGNIEKADEYFASSLDYFTQSLAKDPKNFDATYSMGALYYNKAASMTSKLNELSNDYSSAGTKKFNDIKAQMDAIFLQALPFFLKAEELDPKDQNTMIALKEIYARDGKLDKSAEYKAKLEALGQK
ncbi:MAG: hypothetical protein WAU01_05435 [Saprospiraceae bacterium]